MSLIDITRVIIKSVLLSSPTPLTIHQLDQYYKEQEGKNIPFSQLGYSNLRAYLSSIPDILTYDSVSQTFTVASGGGGKSEHIQKLVSGQKNNKKKSNNPKSFNHSYNGNHFNYNRSKGGKNHNIQVWEDPPVNYNGSNNDSLFNSFNITANPLSHNVPQPFEPGKLLDRPNFGFQHSSLLGAPPMLTIRVPRPVISASSYAPPRQLPKNNKSKTETVKKKSASDDVKPAHIIKQNGYADSSDGKSDSSSEEIAALPPLDDDDPIIFIGSKMMNSKYGRTIPPAIIPQTLKPGQVQQVYVTEVTKFPNFFFQFTCTDETMRGLQEELNLTYGDTNAVENAETIRTSEVRIGNVCAAYYAHKWSRAEILSHDNENLKLLFVDYGTIDHVPVEMTRYLYADACAIPRLCHRGELSFLEPLKNDHLEKKINKLFCEMVADKSLMAVFSNVDNNDGIAMTLIDTSDPKADLIVNKILMKSL